MFGVGESMENTKYIFMHKNIPIAEICIDGATDTISEVNNPMSVGHLPLGVHCADGIIDRRELNSWWVNRSIPTNRIGINNALYTLQIDSPKTLLRHCFGLSLSDQYWIKPINSTLKWEDVNFFDTPFSEDVGNVMFGKEEKAFTLCSPDNTCDGRLMKCWKIIGNKRCLVKSGDGVFCQQPFNELIASEISHCLGISYVPYSLIWQDNNPYSVCEDFVTTETEYFSANSVMNIKTKQENHDDYMHYVTLCEEHGLKDIKRYLDEMIVLDFIIANEDRHFKNYGIIRNANTLEWESAAPVFDNGSSLGYNKLARSFDENIICKPFREDFAGQLVLVTSFDWIVFSNLKGIEKVIDEIMSTLQATYYLGNTRHKEISEFVKKRIELLEEYACGRKRTAAMS